MRMFLALCVLSACGTTATAADWQEMTSKEGRFKVSLPGKATNLKRTLNTPVGKIDLHMFLTTLQGGKVAYAVMYNDYPAVVTQQSTPAKILERAMQGAVKSKNGKITKQTDIKIDGFPGKAVTFVGMTRGQKLTGNIRVYLVNSRLYQLMVFNQSGMEPKQEEIDKFQKSFKRLKE